MNLKFKVIKNENQYFEYCNVLEKLLENEDKHQDEIELLTLLIEHWDEENNSFIDTDPISALKTLMLENNLKAKDLCSILDLSKGSVSKILNYQKGLSKESIRKLSLHFKISQEIFNRPYDLKNKVKKRTSTQKTA